MTESCCVPSGDTMSIKLCGICHKSSSTTQWQMQNVQSGGAILWHAKHAYLGGSGGMDPQENFEM